MRSAYIASALLIACNAHAAPIESPYPNNKETYEDCKNAISVADEGKLKEFLMTPCAARIGGLQWGFTWATAAIPDSKGLEDLIAQQSKRFCVLKELNQNELPELQLARIYVDFIEHYKGDVPFEKFINKRTPSPIYTAFYSYPCKK